jgi:signal transduction histidine kinase
MFSGEHPIHGLEMTILPAYRVLTIALLLLSSAVYCQEIDTLTIDDLKNNGYLIKHWKLITRQSNVQDTAKQRSPDWKIVNPITPITLFTNETGTNKGTLRFDFYADSSIVGKPIALCLMQSADTKITLDGVTIAIYKNAGSTKGNTRGFNPLNVPQLITVNTEGVHNLEVDFEVSTIVEKYGLYVFDQVLSATLREINSAIYLQKRKLISGYGLSLFKMGIWFFLCILHFAFFFYKRINRANLFFGLYALFSGATFLLSILLDFHIHDVTTGFFLSIPFAYGFLLSNYALISAIYALFGKKATMWLTLIKSFIILMGLLLLSNFFFNAEMTKVISYDNSALLIGFLVPFLVNLECLRMSIVEFRKKQRGSRIIVGGAITWAAFSVLTFMFTPDIILGGVSNFWFDLFYNCSQLALPISITLTLALEFSYVSRQLGDRLKEVEILSEKTIAQEKEKREILAKQNEQLELSVRDRTAELQRSIENLKSTQAQLIQSEKMASLGQLTAGIAHEIQNPLNFVNNFSEINVELSEEILEAASKGNIQEVKVLAADIKSNQEKIREHGKRADSIVKGMLQHSRSSSGAKEPTDLAALADEYLRLAYHGMRAKDKDFKVSIKTEFEPNLPKVSVAAQDIGRVLLNLFNNAFYAVNERKKSAGDGYEPEVMVRCGWADNNDPSSLPSAIRHLPTAIQITVQDNGPGIPESIKEKIFQPFFTTKPTGQGTGLGLSLAYDIIKAHGGTLEVSSAEGEGTIFTVRLPV